ITFRQSDGSLKETGENYITPEFGARTNIWRYKTGFGNVTKDKIAYKHPACVDVHTQILTETGWKNYDNVKEKEFVASLNLETKKLEWQQINSIVNYQHRGSVVNIEGRHISICCSLNHRTITKNMYTGDLSIVKAEELNSTRDAIPVAFPWSNNDKRNFIFIKPLLARLAGWFLAEGSFKIRKNQIVGIEIYQSSVNANYVNDIRQICDKFGCFSEYKIRKIYKKRDYILHSFYTSNKNILAFITKWITIDKILNCSVLNWKTGSLYQFIDTFIKGDGHIRINSNAITQYKNKSILQAIFVRLGLDSYLSKKNKYIEVNWKKKHKLLRNSKTSLIKRKLYSGILWCPNVNKNGTFVARRKGRVFVTGNCFPDKLAEDHIISWSNPGDLVIDPMCGSGTVCKAAKKLGRNWIGIDVNEKYVEIANQRLNI
ncbi:MAG: DNA methyltransferase, partial [Nanoarchaeota archaeon]